MQMNHFWWRCETQIRQLNKSVHCTIFKCSTTHVLYSYTDDVHSQASDCLIMYMPVAVFHMYMLFEYSFTCVLFMHELTKVIILTGCPSETKHLTQAFGEESWPEHLTADRCMCFVFHYQPILWTYQYLWSFDVLVQSACNLYMFTWVM